MTKPNILCVGHVNLDEVLYLDKELEQERSTGVDSVISAGGGATNTAMVLSNNNRIGNVYLAGSVGKDKKGDKVVSFLNDNNVELALPKKDGLTTKIRAIITDNKNPQYMHEDEEIMEFYPDDVSDEIWNNVQHVHITSFDVDMATKFAVRAKEENKTISFNPTQGYFDESFGDVVEQADLIQMNRGESETFAKRHGSIGAVVDSGNGSDIVVTHGPAGCTFYAQDGLANHEGFTVDSVTDTVGEGDSFIAGLISAWIHDESLEESLKIANAHGALSVMQKGAPKSISNKDIQELINST